VRASRWPVKPTIHAESCLTFDVAANDTGAHSIFFSCLHTALVRKVNKSWS